jgi:peptide/nickel transport system permease protein
MVSTTSSPDHADAVTVERARPSKRMGRLNRWDAPWFNAKLISGSVIIGTILLIGVLGRYFWDTDLAYAASSPLNLPPVGFERDTLRGRVVGTWDHPLGTENSGRDMLALMMLAAPNSFMVGVIAASVGMSVGIFLGFSAGFIGGRVDDLIRLMSDVTVTIPALMVLIVIQSLLAQIDLMTMALLIALFAWPSPTRLIRAQVLSMRESGYVQMAKLSGASTFSIMFREMMPNLLPYLAASWIGNAAGAILAAIGLEVLGLGPQRVPTLGGTIYFALGAAAMLRNMWWWWGLPTLALVTMFIGLLLINLGLDEIANPRLRQSSQ